jgi:hypothetical protein
MDSLADDIGVVKVTVSTAVEFIANLQRREEKPFPRLRDCSLDRSLCPDYDSKEWGLLLTAQMSGLIASFQRLKKRH